MTWDRCEAPRILATLRSGIRQPGLVLALVALLFCVAVAQPVHAQEDAAPESAQHGTTTAPLVDSSLDVDARSLRIDGGTDASLTSDASSDVGADVTADALDQADAQAVAVGAESLEAGVDAATDAAFVEAPPPPPTTSEVRPKPIAAEKRTRLAVQTVVGLLFLLVLAYVANHPRVRRLEDVLGVQSAITAGFPFVALGLLAHRPEVGVLTDEVLVGLTPLVEFGLGWLGFRAGFKLDTRALEQLPKGTALVILLGTVVPFVAIAVACGLLLLLLGVPWHEGVFLRSGIVLGAAGAMAAPTAIRAIAPESMRQHITQHLDEVAGVVGLALIAAYFRPADTTVTWVLPGTGWLFLTVGMGALLGGVLYVILLRPASDAEFIAIAVGAIAFTAGMAAYLHLSPLVVCFLAGFVMANLPTARGDELGAVLQKLERPVFLVFLTLAGALWDPRDWRGWVLLPVFLVSRYLGLWLGRVLGAKREPEAFRATHPRSSWAAPVSVVAIAVVINVRSLYHGDVVPLMITAVIAGALVTELVSALASRIKEGA